MHLHGPANRPPGALLDDLLPALPYPPLSAVDSQDCTCIALTGRPLASNVQLLRREVTDGHAPSRLEASSMDRGYVSLAASLLLALELVDPAEVARGCLHALEVDLRHRVCPLRRSRVVEHSRVARQGLGRCWLH